MRQTWGTEPGMLVNGDRQTDRKKGLERLRALALAWLAPSCLLPRTSCPDTCLQGARVLILTLEALPPPS